MLGLCGSLGAASVTRRALKIALDGAQQAGANISLIDLRDWNLPLGGAEFSPAAFPDVERLHQQVSAAHGFIWATPEYHGSFSGVLKNALDLLTIQHFEGKMIGLLGVAAGSMGASSSLSHLRIVGRHLHAWVLPGQVSVASSYQAFHENGAPKDSDVEKRLREMGRDVARFALLHTDYAQGNAALLTPES